MLDICFAGGHLHIFYRNFLFFAMRFFVPFSFMVAQRCISSAAPLSVHVWGLRYVLFQKSIFTQPPFFHDYFNQLVFQVAKFTGLDQCRQLCVTLIKPSSLSLITGKKTFSLIHDICACRKYSNFIIMASSLSSLSLSCCRFA